MSDNARVTPRPWEWVAPKNPGWDDHGPNLRSVEMGRVSDAYWGPDGNGEGHYPHKPRPEDPRVISAWGHDAWGIDVSPADAAYITKAVNTFDYAEVALGLAYRVVLASENPGLFGDVESRLESLKAALDGYFEVLDREDKRRPPDSETEGGAQG